MKGGENHALGFFWLVLILLAGVAVRFFFLHATGSVIDADEAIVGLMAKHIAEGGPIPIFYYGQHYMGSPEAIMAAGFFRLFGPSSFLLKLVPTLFSVWLILLIYLLARRYTDRFGARVAAFLAAAGPVALIEWSTRARGGFIELVALGTLALIIATDILRRDRRLSSGEFIKLGLVLGLAWWMNNQAIFYLLSIGLVVGLAVLFRFGFAKAVVSGVAGGAAFLAGGAPFWAANLLSSPRFQTFQELGKRAKFPQEFLAHLKGFFTEALPIICGARRFWSTDDIFSGSTVLVCSAYALLLVIALFARRPGRNRRERSVLQRRSPVGLPFVFLITVPLVFSASQFGWLSQAPRYVLPLYSVLFLLAGVGVSALVQGGSAVGKLIGYGLMFTLAGTQLASNYLGGLALPGQPYVSEGDRVARDQSALYEWLRAHGYDHMMTNYWIGYRAAFETGERLTFSLYGDPRNVRIPAYQRSDAGFTGLYPYVLVPKQAKRLGDLFSARGYEYRSTQVGDYVVFDLVRPTVEPGRMIPLRADQLRVSSRPEWAGRLIDGDAGSRWGSGSPQARGMYLEVAFVQPQRVSNIVIDQGFWPQDAAKSMLIEAEDASGGRCVLFEGPVAEYLADSGGKLQVNFPARNVKSLRFIQQGSDPIFDWSVAELSLYEPKQPVP